MQPPAEEAAMKSRGRHWALHQHLCGAAVAGKMLSSPPLAGQGGPDGDNWVLPCFSAETLSL